MSHPRQGSARRVTIKDVAQAAGVSVTTVSNALNGRTGAMAEATLRRIQDTIRLLGYHPSRVARSLVTNQTATIGVMVDEITTPLFLQALNDIETIARSADHNILLCTAHNPSDEQQTVNLLLEKQVDGIIFLCNSLYLDQDYLADLPVLAPPIVLVNRTTRHNRFDQINWDNVKGVMAAVDYLVQSGHRYIAHLYGPASRCSSKERLQGYRQGLEKHQINYRQAYVRSGDYFTAAEAEWVQSTLELLALPQPPTAIIAANDIVATAVMRTVQRSGLNVPHDITVIGIDDQPFCTYLNPTLTTIALPIIQSGKLATEMLLAWIRGERSQAEHLLLSCPLIIRESSAAVPVAA